MEIDWQRVAQIFASLVVAATGWFGVRRSRAVVKAQGAPREAEPHLDLTYTWPADPTSATKPTLTLHIGNQQPRPIVLQQLDWLVLSDRLRWELDESVHVRGSKIVEGDGQLIDVRPDRALTPIASGRRFDNWLKQLRVVSGLRLSVLLQSGEEVSRRVPWAMRCHLARQYGCGRIRLAIVRVHAWIFP